MNTELKFKNGEFKIMSIGDLHEELRTDTREKRKKREDMHNLIKMGILAFKPDLIVLLGDTLSKKDESDGFEVYKAALKDILAPILKSKIPFCYVLGNHEHDTLQEDLIVEAYSEISTCIGKNDPTAGYGNFNCNLTVKSGDGEKDILNLWFIDSNNLYHDKSVSYYDCVHKEQIEWYEKKALEFKEKNGGETVPAILFQHIPVIEEYRLLREATPKEYFVSVDGHNKFSDKKYVLKDGVDGYLGEGPATPDINCGQFESWKKTGDVKAAFFGHDHLNDFTGYVDGIMLGQNKTSGFGCYTDGCRSAIRITTVKEDEPSKINSVIYHFKELGLESHSLGPIEKRITDRQSINMHKASYAAAGVIGIGAVSAIIKKLKK